MACKRQQRTGRAGHQEPHRKSLALRLLHGSKYAQCNYDCQTIQANRQGWPSLVIYARRRPTSTQSSLLRTSLSQASKLTLGVPFPELWIHPSRSDATYRVRYIHVTVEIQLSQSLIQPDELQASPRPRSQLNQTTWTLFSIKLATYGRERS